MTGAAKDDLAEIWLTIATETSATVADDFILALEHHFEPLRSFPNSGAPRDHLRPNLRVVFHQPYLIYYRPLSDAVVILRILHGARDIAEIIERGGFADE